MNRYDGTPNRLERFIMEASFPLRLLICIFGLGFIGFLLGLADALAEFIQWYI